MASDPSVSPAEPPTCDYCGYLGWTVEKYGRVTHKQGCPHRTDPWHQGDPVSPADTPESELQTDYLKTGGEISGEPDVSPADTIRRHLPERYEGIPRVMSEQWSQEAHAALDALLAAGERDKAEITELRERHVDQIRDLDKLRLRDGQRIAQLTEALEQQDAVIALVTSYVDDLLDRARSVNEPRVLPDDPAGPFAVYVEARLADLVKRVAVLADKEDAGPVCLSCGHSAEAHVGGRDCGKWDGRCPCEEFIPDLRAAGEGDT